MKYNEELYKKLTNNDAIMRSIIGGSFNGLGFYRFLGQEIQLLCANEEYFECFGYTEKTLLLDSKDMLRPVAEEDRTKVLEALLDAVSMGMSQRISFRRIHTDGRVLWLDCIFTYVGEYNEAHLISISFYDISNQKETEIILREQRQQLAEDEAIMRAVMRHAKLQYFFYLPHERAAIKGGSRALWMIDVERLEDFPYSWIQQGAVYKDDCQEMARAFQLIDRGMDRTEFDARCYIDGEFVWQRFCLVSIYSKSGMRTNVIVTVSNIAEQKDAEDRCREMNEYRRIEALNSVASSKLNLTRNTISDQLAYDEETAKALAVSSVDEHFLVIASALLDNLARQSFREIFDRKVMLQQFEKGVTHFEFEMEFPVAKELRWLKVMVEAFKNPITGDVEAFCVAKDINDYKLSEQLNETVFDMNYEFVKLIDVKTGRLMIVRGEENASKQKHFLFCDEDYEEFGAKRFRSFCCDFDVEEKIRRRSLANLKHELEYKKEFQLLYTFDEGGVVTHKRATYSYLKNNKNIICYVCANVNSIYEEEKKRREELQSALEEARKASRAKSDFLSRMSHEIRTPMNAVISLSSLGMGETKEATAHDYFSKIHSSGQYLLSIINDILDMSRIENGAVELFYEEVDRLEVWEEIVDIIRPSLQERKINLVVADNATSIPYVYLDKLRWKQIYVNILSNAVKFSEIGGRIDCSCCVVEEDIYETVLEYTIQDYGCGMSEDFLPRLFLPFAQEHNKFSDTFPGTGLGLAIVKKLIDQMGGSVAVESTLEEGTKYTLRFTLQKGNGEHIAKCDSGSESGIMELRGKHILQAEDNGINAQVMKILLRKRGAQVYNTENGAQVLSVFKASPEGYYDAIMMDVRMPIMDGLEATQAIRHLDRQDAKTIPIIAITADVLDSNETNMLEVGMNAYVAKPIVPKILYKVLQEQLSKKGEKKI